LPSQLDEELLRYSYQLITQQNFSKRTLEMKEVTKEVYLKWYEDMLLWRKFEDKLAALYIQQKS
jgi:pyruvate dehydrogenase E1 component alpha subunit